MLRIDTFCGNLIFITIRHDDHIKRVYTLINLPEKRRQKYLSKKGRMNDFLIADALQDCIEQSMTQEESAAYLMAKWPGTTADEWVYSIDEYRPSFMDKTR